LNKLLTLLDKSLPALTVSSNIQQYLKRMPLTSSTTLCVPGHNTKLLQNQPSSSLSSSSLILSPFSLSNNNHCWTNS
jgi:hypothetical protein